MVSSLSKSLKSTFHLLLAPGTKSFLAHSLISGNSISPKFNCIRETKFGISNPSLILLKSIESIESSSTGSIFNKESIFSALGIINSCISFSESILFSDIKEVSFIGSPKGSNAGSESDKL